MHPDAIPAFLREARISGRNKWRCDACGACSSKRRNLRCKSGCKGKVTYRNDIQRIAYFGHGPQHLWNDRNTAHWICYFCRHEWDGADGEVCPACNRHWEEKWMTGRVKNCCCDCHRKTDLMMFKIRPKKPNYKDNFVPLCCDCAGKWSVKPERDLLIKARRDWLSACGSLGDLAW